MWFWLWYVHNPYTSFLFFCTFQIATFDLFISFAFVSFCREIMKLSYMICLCYCFNLYYIFISKKNRRMSMMCSIKSYILWVIGTPIFPLKKKSTPVFIIVFGLNLISFSCRLKMWPAHILTLFSRHFGDMLCDCWPLLYISYKIS